MIPTRTVGLLDEVPPGEAVVVIDVLRAFTTAAVALAAGAGEIMPVASVDEAFAAREQDPDLRLLGEVDGHPIDGFDFGNSPVELAAAGAALAGRTLVQRTSSGTQGVVRNLAARPLLAASFACAGATADLLVRLAPPAVTFVVTGSRAADGGDEDRACADYLAALLAGSTPDPAPYLDRVRCSAAAKGFLPGGELACAGADLDACCVVDRVPFAMVVSVTDGRPRIRAALALRR